MSHTPRRLVVMLGAVVLLPLAVDLPAAQAVLTFDKAPVSHSGYTRMLQSGPRSVTLQTAVQRFQSRDRSVSVDLHSVLHVGDRDFFQSLQASLESDYDVVICELLASRSDRRRCADGLVRLRRRLHPSPSNEALAMRYGLCPQLDELDFAASKAFVVGDLTREELRARSISIPGSGLSEALAELQNSFTSSSFLSESLSPRLLPSQFFLPGAWAARVLRSALWLSPIPEVNILSFDVGVLGAGAISPVSHLIVDALATGDVLSARKLYFMHEVFSAEVPTAAGGGLLRDRNRRGIYALRQALSAAAAGEQGQQGADGQGDSEKISAENSPCRVAMVYGELHCDDLERRLEDLGLRKNGPSEWRDTVTVEVAPPELPLPASLVAVPLYLGLSSADWIQEVARLSTEAAHQEWGAVAIEVLLYLFRHVQLLTILGKAAVLWNGQGTRASSGKTGGGR